MSLNVSDAMVREFHTIDSIETVKHAAEKMCQLSIGSLLVFCGNNLVGTVSMRDIVQNIIINEAKAEKVLVEEIMNSPVIAVNSEMPLAKAVTIMMNENINYLPVIKQEENTRLVGTLSFSDMARLHSNIFKVSKLEEIDENNHVVTINLVA